MQFVNLSVRASACVAVSVAALAGTAVASPAWFDQATASQNISAIAQGAGMPGISVAVRRLDQPGVGTAVWGTRRVSTGEAVTAADRFHCGSNSKAFTAQVAARAVDSGAIGWNTTIGEVFGGDSTIDPGYAGVTLGQLLSHQGGTPQLGEFAEWDPLYSIPGTPSEQRLAFSRSVLSQPRAVAPGASLGERYSNAGYSIAAAMVERRTGQTWESAVGEVFNQGMGLNVEVGAPGRSDGTAQPAGHLVLNGVVVEYGSEWSLPSAVAPAGDLNMSMADLSEFGLQHLRALSGLSNTLGLTAESVATLHDFTLGDDYGMGWFPIGDPSRGIYGFGHDGSTSVFNSLLFVDSINGLSIAVGSNGYLGSQEELYITPALFEAMVAARQAAIPSPGAGVVVTMGAVMAARRRRSVAKEC